MKPTDADLAAVQAFTNFLSWGEKPIGPNGPTKLAGAVPPAWWAYVLGHSRWCPPKGEM